MYDLDYELLDLDDGRKLERFGRVRIVRPALAARGPRRLAAGEWQQAEYAWTKSVDLEPTGLNHANLGTLHYYMGRYDDAIEQLRTASQLAPSDPRPWGKLGAALRESGAERDKEEAFAKAIALAGSRLDVDPNNAYELAYLASYYANIDDLVEATATIDRARSLDNDDPEVMYFDAYVKTRSGDFDGAMNSLEKALELGYSERLVSVDPIFEPLRERKDFARILKRHRS